MYLLSVVAAFAAPDLELSFSSYRSNGARLGNDVVGTHLLMSKAQFVLQDDLSVTQELYFICENVEIICKCFDESFMIKVRGWHGFELQPLISNKGWE